MATSCFHQIFIEMYQEETKPTYMGPVVTSQELSWTFYNDNKQKHQLVLWLTSLCFLDMQVSLAPFHVRCKSADTLNHFFKFSPCWRLWNLTKRRDDIVVATITKEVTTITKEVATIRKEVATITNGATLLSFDQPDQMGSVSDLWFLFHRLAYFGLYYNCVKKNWTNSFLMDLFRL